MCEVIITDHAFRRAKERCSLSKKALRRTAEKAYFDGYDHAKLKGRIRRYIDKRLMQYKKRGVRIKIYGEYMYIFTSNVLVTLFGIPNDFKAYVKELKKNGDKDA